MNDNEIKEQFEKALENGQYYDLKELILKSDYALRLALRQLLYDHATLEHIERIINDNK